MQIQEINIAFDQVKPDVNRIIACMGYKNLNKEEHVYQTTVGLISESQKYSNVVGGYRLFLDDDVTIDSENMVLNEVVFCLDKIIAKQIRKISSVAFMTVTLGKNYDAWINHFFQKGDPFKGYITDMIGSEMVENSADVIEDIIVEETQKLDLGCTNRYSPGYCGWHVSEQHKFFSFLPEKFCGISVSDSALMNPIKSISAIIGIGKEVEKKDYQCSLCDLEDCYKRNRQKITS